MHHSDSYGHSQAIYPTTILFLVVLKKSPIDNGGLSQVQRAVREHWHGGARPASPSELEGRGSTIVFHRSAAFHSGSAVVNLEDAMDVAVPTDVCQEDTRFESESSESRQSSVTMCDGEEHRAKDVSTLV